MTAQIRNTLYALAEERDTDTIPLDVAVEEASERLDLPGSEVLSGIKDVAEIDSSPFGDEIVRLPKASEETSEESAEKETTQDKGVADYDGDIAALTMEPGAPTERTEHFLPVHEDVGHPLVPTDKPYYAREIEGTNRTDLDVIGHYLRDGDYAVLLVGHAGTGKNAAINKLGAKTFTPVVRLPFSNDITYEDVVGTYAPREDGSGFEWRDGVLTAAVRHGWWVVCDEINAAPPEATTALHQVTEENGEAELLIRETQEAVQPHSNFRFIGTMNPDYAGTKPMNMAFASRFKHLEMDYLPPTAEKAVLDDKTDLSESDADKLVRMAGGLRDRLKKDDITTPVTPRHLIQIGRESEIMPLEAAAKQLLLPYADYNDRDVMESVIEKFL